MLAAAAWQQHAEIWQSVCVINVCLDIRHLQRNKRLAAAGAAINSVCAKINGVISRGSSGALYNYLIMHARARMPLLQRGMTQRRISITRKRQSVNVSVAACISGGVA